MLTERQINIIVFLINADEWVTSDRLSISFHVNKKTIQAEIKEISQILGHEITIVSNKHHGYHIDHITEDGLKKLISQLNYHEKKNCLPPRQSAFILYLMFLKSYITMQNLADIFFISKTAVSLEINVIKRWIERYEGLTLEISNKNGIMIHASEEKKRIYCSKHGTLRAFKELPFPDELKQKYEEVLIKSHEILAESCIQFNYVLTGEELQKITQFLASSIIRSRMGYSRVGEFKRKDLDPIVYIIKNKIKNELHYEMTEAELCDLHLIWSESNTIRENTLNDIDISHTLKQCMKKIMCVIGIDYEIDCFDLQMLESYIHKMKLRYQSGDIAINHYNEDIVMRYPLEAYLAYRYFSQYFSMKVTKETSFIALFLSTFLEKSKYPYSVLLVSDQNSSVILSLQNTLRNITGYSVEKEFLAVPVYQYQKNPVMRTKYDILLTTDQETVLSDHNFFLISPIISKEDTIYLQEYVQKCLEKKNNKLKQELKERYVKEFTVSNKGSYHLDIFKIIKMQDSNEMSYHTFQNDQLYIGCISSKVSTAIQIYHLKEPVNFKYKKIKRIILACFHEGDDQIFCFFEAISDIIHHK